MHTKNRATKKHVLKSAGMVSFMTLISRVLGMVRDIFNAHMFGIGRVWDAFVFAFMLPNFIRRLLGEGALSGAFIPLYAELLNKNGKKEADAFTNIIISILLVGLGAVLLAGTLVCGWLLHFVTLPDKVCMIMGLLQIFAPYVIILCALAVVVGVLNCHKKFFIPSLMPIMLNTGWLLAIVTVCQYFGTTLEIKAYVLALSIVCVGGLQGVMQGIALYRTGFRFRFNFNIRHPFFSKLITLMIPAVLGFSVMQINILVDLFLGFLIGDGANSALWYGNRLMQFPLGMFGIAMGTVLLPTISHQAARENFEEMKDTLSFALRIVSLVIVPSTVGFIVLRTPIVSLLFEGGLFDHTATVKAANTLMAYSFGLFAYAGLKLLLPSFYSLKDTRTPMRIGVLCMILNVVLNVILMIPMKEVGIALSTSVTNAINFIVLFIILGKQIGKIQGLTAPFIRICIASAVMGVLIWYVYPMIPVLPGMHHKIALAVKIFGTIGVGIVFYFVFCFVLGMRELKSAWQLIMKKEKA